MSDNVAITAGSGTTIATDERTIASTSVQVQRVDEQGSQTLATEQAAPGTTATSATVAARDTRKRLILINHGSVDLYVSERATNAGTPSSTTAHSVKVPPGASLELYATAAAFVFTASGTGALHYIEEYD